MEMTIEQVLQEQMISGNFNTPVVTLVFNCGKRARDSVLNNLHDVLSGCYYDDCNLFVEAIRKPLVSKVAGISYKVKQHNNAYRKPTHYCGGEAFLFKI